jgi:hypothetical protein
MTIKRNKVQQSYFSSPKIYHHNQEIGGQHCLENSSYWLWIRLTQLLPSTANLNLANETFMGLLTPLHIRPRKTIPYPPWFTPSPISHLQNHRLGWPINHPVYVYINAPYQHCHWKLMDASQSSNIPWFNKRYHCFIIRTISYQHRRLYSSRQLGEDVSSITKQRQGWKKHTQDLTNPLLILKKVRKTLAKIQYPHLNPGEDRLLQTLLKW